MIESGIEKEARRRDAASGIALEFGRAKLHIGRDTGTKPVNRLG
jgi:hypothetical protein